MVTREDKIVALVADRARHLLELEALVGSTTPIQKGRMADEELEGRIDRLWAFLEHLSDQARALSRLSAENVLPDDPDLFETLTPTEIEAAFEDWEPRPDLRNDVKIAGGLAKLTTDLQRSSSEARAILGGRFHGERSRGMPPRRRGRQIAAHLIGFAEGLGLRPTRTRHAKGRQVSATDVVQEALARGTIGSLLADPVVRAIWAEIPKTEPSLEKLVVASTSDDHLDEWRSRGRMIGESQRARLSEDNAE